MSHQTTKERWYWCDIIDDPPKAAPQIDRVPENKREMVMRAWEASLPVGVVWKLWGGQINLYHQMCHSVKVLGAAGEHTLTEDQRNRLVVDAGEKQVQR